MFGKLSYIKNINQTQEGSVIQHTNRIAALQSKTKQRARKGAFRKEKLTIENSCIFNQHEQLIKVTTYELEYNHKVSLFSFLTAAAAVMLEWRERKCGLWSGETKFRE